MNNLIDHSQYEMERAGLFDEDADYGGAAANAVMDLIKVFSDQEHSGMSAGLTLALFYKLASFEPLTDITSDPDEWMHVADASDDEHGTRQLHQNKRRSTSFSTDGGKTWYDIQDPSRDNGARWPGWPEKDEPEATGATRAPLTGYDRDGEAVYALLRMTEYSDLLADAPDDDESADSIYFNHLRDRFSGDAEVLAVEMSCTPTGDLEAAITKAKETVDDEAK